MSLIFNSFLSQFYLHIRYKSNVLFSITVIVGHLVGYVRLNALMCRCVLFTIFKKLIKPSNQCFLFQLQRVLPTQQPVWKMNHPTFSVPSKCASNLRWRLILENLRFLSTNENTKRLKIGKFICHLSVSIILYRMDSGLAYLKVFFFFKRGRNVITIILSLNRILNYIV